MSALPQNSSRSKRNTPDSPLIDSKSTRTTHETKSIYDQESDDSDDSDDSDVSNDSDDSDEFEPISSTSHPITPFSDKNNNEKTQNINNETFSESSNSTLATNSSSSNSKQSSYSTQVLNGKTLYSYPDLPAQRFPFKIDDFQHESCTYIQNDESVLVSAHTSAGKTCIAKYAIAKSFKDNQRVIYTSPIKALSNQKYRELSQEFDDVGLMTGDVTRNPDAGCLVMTTEILRSMLYRGNEIMRQIHWIIFDEIHYMANRERGVVWEESIILLPNTCKFVFLSATIPNSQEFADWVSKVKNNQKVHVVYTEYRPTPLIHHIYPAGGTQMFPVINERSEVLHEHFAKAISQVGGGASLSSQNPSGGRNNRKAQELADRSLAKLIRLTCDNGFTPMIVFSFSRKQCDDRAYLLAKDDFTDSQSKQLIENVFEKAVSRLSKANKTLKQVKFLRSLLTRGIGIHHSGLLPLLKEVTELLFQEGLVKILFATETFAMGLSMPAKTVIFGSLKKFDGQDFRLIDSGEYIQMSGRAGRRGRDERGIVMVLLGEPVEPQELKNIMKGQAKPLISAFRLSFNMLLNLLRVEGVSPSFMLKSCFHQFQNDNKIPAMKAHVEKLQKKYDLLETNYQGPIQKLYFFRESLIKLRQEFRHFYHLPQHILPFLSIGRLVRVYDDDTNIENRDWGWGCVIQVNAKRGMNLKRASHPKDVVVDVFIECLYDKKTRKTLSKPAFPAIQAARKAGKTLPETKFAVIPFTLALLDGVSSVTIPLPNSLKNQQLVKAGKLLKKVYKTFSNGIPQLDPIEDLRIKNPQFLKCASQIEKIEKKLYNHIKHLQKNHSQLSEKKIESEYSIVEQRMKIGEQIKQITAQFNDNESSLLVNEMNSMMTVLRKMEYINENDVIQTKGRVACEIQSCDELVATELLLSGMFTSMDPPAIIGILSCLQAPRKAGRGNQVTIPQACEKGYAKLLDIARNIAHVSTESQIDIDEEEYVETFQPSLMTVCVKWASGESLPTVLKSTGVFAGNLIRFFRRLSELLVQFAAAAKELGNDELEAKFMTCISCINRDVVSSSSLYLEVT